MTSSGENELIIYKILLVGIKQLLIEKIVLIFYTVAVIKSLVLRNNFVIIKSIGMNFLIL